MKKTFRRTLPILIAGTVLLAGLRTFGLGSDYGTNHTDNTMWPKGMFGLVNCTNRIHGFFVNEEDIFFFRGNPADFSAFLSAYSKIEGVKKHQLVIHEGEGEARSPWEKTGLPCDWRLYGCPQSWLNLGSLKTNSLEAAQAATKDTNYVLTVDYWTGRKFALDQVTIPKNIEVTGDCFKNFESITNGMTRVEVEKRLMTDGGLQGVAAVRFIDPACPGFKISVEFDFQKDAADQGRAIESKDDKVIRISKPYLERPFTD